MTVRYTLKRGQPLTQEQIAEFDALKDRPIVFDDDCPEMTEEQLKLFRRVNPHPFSAEPVRRFG